MCVWVEVGWGVGRGVGYSTCEFMTSLLSTAHRIKMLQRAKNYGLNYTSCPSFIKNKGPDICFWFSVKYRGQNYTFFQRPEKGGLKLQCIPTAQHRGSTLSKDNPLHSPDGRQIVFHQGCARRLWNSLGICRQRQPQVIYRQLLLRQSYAGAHFTDDISIIQIPRPFHFALI